MDTILKRYNITNNLLVFDFLRTFNVALVKYTEKMFLEKIYFENYNIVTS